MMRVLLTICFLTFLASSALGQAAGTIYLCADSLGYSCSIQDTSPGIVKVHMIVDLPNGWAVDFGAPKPECWTGATYLGEAIVTDIPLGNTQSDIGLTATIGIVGSGICSEGASNSPKYIGFMSYITTGQAPTCCEYPVIKTIDTYDEIPGPVGAVCSDLYSSSVDIVLMQGGSAFINPNSSCPCMITVPAEKHTWGEIKALYQ